MVKIYRIPVPKDALERMPEHERALLLLLGYIANQISMIWKFISYSKNYQPVGEIDENASAVQAHMLVRLMAGMVNEAWQVVTKQFLQSRLGKEYVELLDEGGRQALADLKRLFGNSNLLTQVRNNFAFHYPDSGEINAAFEAASKDETLKGCFEFYFSEHGFNSLFLISDAVMVHGIGRMGGGDTVAVHKELMDALTRASLAVNEFLKAFVAAAWRRHMGSEMAAREVVDVNAPSGDAVILPFFIEN